jgi:hypothetical protein
LSEAGPAEPAGLTGTGSPDHSAARRRVVPSAVDTVPLPHGLCATTKLANLVIVDLCSLEYGPPV